MRFVDAVAGARLAQGGRQRMKKTQLDRNPSCDTPTERPKLADARKHHRDRLPHYYGPAYSVPRKPKRKLEPGKSLDDEHLYPLCPPAGWTSIADLGDFGFGIYLYFWTLRTLAVVFFLVGVLNLPTLVWFQADAYKNAQGHLSRSESAPSSFALIPGDLSTSAVCMNRILAYPYARRHMLCRFDGRLVWINLATIFLLLLVFNAMKSVLGKLL